MISRFQFKTCTNTTEIISCSSSFDLRFMLKLIITIPPKLVIRRLFLPCLSINDEATAVPAMKSNADHKNSNGSILCSDHII